MTVIAYAKGIMACDSLWSDGQSPAAYKTKIRRFGTGALYGGSGGADDRALVAVLAKVRKEADFPTAKFLRENVFTNEELNCLFVLPDGKIWTLYGGPQDSDPVGVCPITLPYWAGGCGAEFALGAMHQGASAKEAVQAACFHSVFCKPPVHALSLKQKANAG